jgi:hypothetical protein
MVAEPMLRAGNPETVALLVWGALCAASMAPRQRGAIEVQRNTFIAARRTWHVSIFISLLMLKEGFLKTGN